MREGAMFGAPRSFRTDVEIERMLKHLARRWHTTPSGAVRRTIIDSFNAEALAQKLPLSRTVPFRKRVWDWFHARAPPTCFAGFPRMIARGDLRGIRYPGGGSRAARVTIRDLHVPEFLGRNHLTL